MIVSKVMGDKAHATFWIAIVRPLLGTLCGAFIQAFFLSFTDFGIPASVGGRFEVVASVLYDQMLGGIPNFGKGAAVAMIMLLPSIVSICLYSIWSGLISVIKRSATQNCPKTWSEMLCGQFCLSLHLF